MDSYRWYQMLIKPSWAPPSWLFGPVWSVLYSIIGVTFSVVFYKAIQKEIPWTVTIPFVLNLVFNFAFTTIQFSFRNNLLASIDVLLVVVTLVWAFLAIWPYARWVVYANIPYLFWGIFASILQLSITYLNAK